MSKANLRRGALAGAVGGLVGAWTMSRSAALLRKVLNTGNGKRGFGPAAETRRFVDGSSQEIDSVTAAAQWVDKFVLGRRLSRRQLGALAAGVHYATGATLGAVYGAVAEIWPAVTRGMGVPVAVAESLLIESAGLSVVGMTRPFADYPAREHAQSALEHAVFGATLEGSRRAVQKLLS